MSDLRAELLAIPVAIDESKRRKIENWPVKSNRASEIGHPCVRYLVYNRTRWQEKPLHDVGLQYLFDERTRQEDHAIEDLREAGYVFIQQQRPFAWDRYNITGRIDGMLALPRGASDATLVPAEIKNVNRWLWEMVEPHKGIQQFLDHAQVWARKIPFQVISYLLMAGKDLGALIMRNADNGRPKVVPVELDYEIGERVLKAAEAVEAHVAAGTLPDRIPYSEEVCGRCAFFHICLPDEALRSGLSLIDDADLEAKLARRAELQGAVREFERLDKEVKAVALRALPEDGEALVGTDWLLRAKTVQRKGYVVEASSYQRVEIERLGSGKESADD